MIGHDSLGIVIVKNVYFCDFHQPGRNKQEEYH